jgi:hypothetical protein
MVYVYGEFKYSYYSLGYICTIMVLRNQLVTAGGTNVCTPEPVGQMYFVCRRHAISRLMEGIDVVLTHSEPKQSRHIFSTQHHIDVTSIYQSQGSKEGTPKPGRLHPCTERLPPFGQCPGRNKSEVHSVKSTGWWF